MTIVFDRDPASWQPRASSHTSQQHASQPQPPTPVGLLFAYPTNYPVAVAGQTTASKTDAHTQTKDLSGFESSKPSRICGTIPQSNLRSDTMSFQNAGVPVDVGNQGSRRAMSSYISAQTSAAHHHEANGGMTGHQYHTGPAAQADNLVAQFGSMSLPATTPIMPGQSAGYMTTADSAGVFGGYGAAVQPAFNMGPAPENFFNTVMPGTSFFQGPISTGYAPCVFPYTPGRGVSFTDRPVRDVPGLDDRRGSYSTTATESTPGTPFFGGLADRHNAPRVISTDRSSYTTPSPQQIAVSGMIGHTSAKSARVYDAELQALVKQDPAIPAAVPAVFTTPDQRKSLDQCLENRIDGNKNVYIRGLHPTTDDDLLLKYAARFGEVEQSKAIIDTATGACKGFGFAKFKNVHDSEKCIQGFYLLGYEVGFARESFNARLKAEGDESSTNLYISNLPKSMGELHLAALFHPYRILSSKVLRDSMGNSRGVGFARFESRDICERLIKDYHGRLVGDECMAVQIRYADTPAQKELKRVTAERRQYRTNEYNIGAYGTMAVGINPSIYHARPTWPHVPPFPSDRGSFRAAYPGKGGKVMQGRDHQQSAPASGTPISDVGSGDEGVTVIDSPTVAVKLQSSPTTKDEDA